MLNEPAGWVELLTSNDWLVMSGKAGVLIISDAANEGADGGPKYHDRGCPFARREYYAEKVLAARVAGRAPNGRHFWAANARVASDGGARPCLHNADPLNF